MRPQGAGARLDRRAGGADVGDLGEAPLELFQALAVGGGATSGRLAPLGRAGGGGAALLELHTPPRHECQRLRSGPTLGLMQRRLGVRDRRPQLLRLQQRPGRGGVRRFLACGRLGELCGDALYGAQVALQMLFEVAPARTDLREAALGGLGGDARLALCRHQPRPTLRAPPPAARRRA